MTITYCTIDDVLHYMVECDLEDGGLKIRRCGEGLLLETDMLELVDEVSKRIGIEPPLVAVIPYTRG